MRTILLFGALLALLPACRPRQQTATPTWPPPRATADKEEAEQESAPAPPPPPPPEIKPTSPPPTGEAGFVFGQTRKEAMAACTVHFVWRRMLPNYACSKPLQDPGFSGSPVLSFCDDRLCAVGIAVIPKGKDFQSWDSEFSKIRALLVKRHGQPTTSEDVIPDECKNDRFVECLDAGKAKRELTWKWDTHSVLLRMSKKQSGGPSAIRFVSMPKSN